MLCVHASCFCFHMRYYWCWYLAVSTLEVSLGLRELHDESGLAMYMLIVITAL